MQNREVQSGDFLIAQPFMLDHHFKRSVVLLCEYREEGTFGFILNKTVKLQINELLPDFPPFESEVFFGGPVQTDTIHYLHNAGDLLEDSQQVLPGVYWGGDFEKLKSLIANQLIKPENIRFFVGYSGWDTGQLEHELQIGSWLIADADANYIFKPSRDNLWKQVLSDQGDTYSVIAGIPDFISWN